MNWINMYGLFIMVIIMIPNIIFGIKNKNYESEYRNNMIEIIEQIGRFGSMFFMIVNIPVLTYGECFANGKLVYAVVNGILVLFYCFTWVLYFQRETKAKALVLAIIPTVIFLFSGIILTQVLLIITAVFFGVGHITITYNNNK